MKCVSDQTAPPLPQGITGFRSGGAGIPKVEFVDFKRACHGVALIAGVRITAFHDAEGQVTPNFHCAALQMSAGIVWMLCNTQFPY